MLQQQFTKNGHLDHDVVIITGKGEHSRDGEPVLRGIVEKLLNEELHILPSCEAEGAGTEAGRLHAPTNLGRLVVPREVMQRWLEARMRLKMQQRKQREEQEASGTEHLEVPPQQQQGKKKKQKQAPRAPPSLL
jgi:hypothetical protein